MLWLAQYSQADPEAGVAHDESPAELPPRLGRFQLKSVLGQGAYGVVFQALDTELDRHVALKVAWPAVMMDPEASRRFVDEPKTIAELSHPGIVQVYDTGSVEMVRYIAFELIDGPTLASWVLGQDRIPVLLAAELIRDIAEALEFAHARGIVHRDLKPSNVLLRRVADSVSGRLFRPVVTDFGLARRPELAAASYHTRTIAFIGSDRYMSPEQAAGQSAEAGPRSDVFSLGVILYELLSGVRPFEGESGDQIRERILREEPRAIRTFRSNVPKDLETIVAKCLEKTPQRRYASAGELADDLRRFLRHEPIAARPISRLQRAWRFARRHPRGVAIASGAVLAGLLVAALFGALFEERRSAAEEVAAANKLASIAEEKERQHQYAGAIRYAARSLYRGDRAEALHHLKNAEGMAHGNVRRGLEWHLIDKMTDEATHVLAATDGRVHCVRFSPASDLLVCGGADGRLSFWDTKSWKEIHSIPHPGEEIVSAEFSPDGTLLAVGDENGRVIVYRAADYSIVFERRILTSDVFAMAWIDEGRQVAVGGRDAIVAVIDTADESVRQTRPLEPSSEARGWDPSHPNEIAGFAFLPERNLLAVLKAPWEMVLLDPQTLHEIERWNELSATWFAGACCAVSMETDYVALVGADRLALLSASDGKLVTSFKLGQMIEGIRFCPEKRLLAASFRDGSVCTWRMEDLLGGRVTPVSFAGHLGRAPCCDLSSNGNWLASGGVDGMVRIRELNASGHSAELPIANRPLQTSFSPCGRWLVVAEQLSADVCVSIFEVATGRKFWSFRPPTPADAPRAHEFFLGDWSPVFDTSGEQAWVQEIDGLSLRRTHSGEVVTALAVSNIGRTQMWLAPDGQSIVIRGMPLTRVIDPTSGDVVFQCGGTQDLIGSFRTPDGELWLDTDTSGYLRFRRSPGATEFRVIGPMNDRMTISAVSADGRLLAVCGNSTAIYLFDLTSNAPPFRLMAADKSVGLTISADGSTLMSRSDVGTVTIYHLPTRTEVLTLGAPDDRILCAAIHPKDSMVVMGHEHGESFGMRVYRLDDSGAELSATFDFDSSTDKSSFIDHGK